MIDLQNRSLTVSVEIALDRTIKQFINFCTKAIDLIKLFHAFTIEWRGDILKWYFCARVQNAQMTLEMNQLLSSLWHLIVQSFYYKNCYCRWQEEKKWDNKTNKYRNAVNRAHKNHFSINFISHDRFSTKTKHSCCRCFCWNKFSKFIDSFMLSEVSILGMFIYFTRG